MQSYDEIARTFIEEGVLSDPWCDGAPRLRLAPHFVSADRLASLCEAAEAVAAALDELVRLCVRRPELLERLGLMPTQRAMWRVACPAWHVLARADVFWTSSGPVVCEINADTPSGEAEAVLLNARAAALYDGCVDPNVGFERSVCAALAAATTTVAGRPPGTVGIVYPTELTEDLSMIALYEHWFSRRGWSVVRGSPFNLSVAGDGRLALFGRPCDALVRHYKTDWWGERLPVWRDATPYWDSAPLHAPLAALLEGAQAGRTAIVNPLGAVVAQNKRSFALLWEERAALSPQAQEAVARFVPFTARLETLPRDKLRAERSGWVIKSDYGCEGDEVLVGEALGGSDWDDALGRAIPTRWIAQRRFTPEREPDGAAANNGIYLVAGCAAGFLTRLSAGATDRTALTAPTLVRSPWT